MPWLPLLRSFTRAPWPLLLLMAASGFGLAAVRAGSGSLASICRTVGGFTIGKDWPSELEAALALSTPMSMMADWALMLHAMMPPLLVMPLMHVWRASLPRRRMRAALVFMLGYGAVWMAAGPALLAFGLLLKIFAERWALVVALVLATIWSASPWQRAALNRGHRLRRIGLFGWAADRDVVLFGANHGLWCIASCWAWMLLPLVGDSWHLAIMLIAGAIMLTERLSDPERPRWHWPVFLPRIDRRILAAAQRGTLRHG